MRTRLAATTLLLIAACNRSDAPPPVVIGSSAQRTLSGTILGPDDLGRAGVEVRGPSRTARGSLAGAAAMVATVTDAQGRFVIQDPPPGTFPYIVDDGTLELTLLVTVAPGGQTVLPHPVRLPDLAAGAADGTLPVAGGVTTAPLSFVGVSARFSAATGTAVAVNGAPAGAPVTLTLSPLGVRDLPVAAPPGLQPVALTAITPLGVTFDPPASLFLATDLPPGAAVEIWAFDPVSGAWTSLPDGVVVEGDTGPEISGAVDRGGWFAAMLPVDPACATRIEGTVRASFGGGAPVPVADVVVRASTGQSALTGPDGVYVLAGVPAYDPAELPACVPLGVTLDVVPPAAVGAAPARIDVATGLVVPDGVTPMGVLTLAATGTGIVSGMVTDTLGALAGAPGYVRIKGPASALLEIDANGAFFRGDLPPGAYLAWHQFPGDPEPRFVSFDIAAGAVTTIDLQRLRGAGARTVEVRVLRVSDLVLEGGATHFSGARVTLAGTDAVSAGGISGTANDEGVLTFQNVDGPFSVTAQVAADYFGSTVALAATVLAIDPPDDRVSVPLGSYAFLSPPDPQDAAIRGTVSNLSEGFEDPATAEEQLILHGTAFRPDGTRVPLFGFVEPDGTYMLEVPSGATLEVVLMRNSFTAATTGAILRSGLGPIGPGETLTLDFDLEDPSFVPFDRAVDVTIENLIVGGFPLLTLRATAPSGALYGFFVGGLFATDPTTTVTLNMPDFVNGPFRDPSMALVGDFLDQFSNYPFPAAADAFTIALPAIPALDAPQGALAIEDTDPLHVTMARNAPGTGPNQLYIEGYSPEGWATGWTVFTDADVISFDLPPAAVPMFSAGHLYFAQACSLELATPLPFAMLFDGDLDQRVGVIAYGQSCAISEFTVD